MRSTTENLIILEEVRRQASNMSPTFGLLVDVTRAFANVDVELLTLRMVQHGLSSTYITAVVALFSSNQFSVLLNGQSGRRVLRLQ